MCPSHSCTLSSNVSTFSLLDLKALAFMSAVQAYVELVAPSVGPGTALTAIGFLPAEFELWAGSGEKSKRLFVEVRNRRFDLCLPEVQWRVMMSRDLL